MNYNFTVNGWKDFEYWLENDKRYVEKIRELLKDISRDPFKGIGKPEPLKENLKGSWSRRITDEHRLVYHVSGKGSDQTCTIVSCRFHY